MEPRDFFNVKPKDFLNAFSINAPSERSNYIFRLINFFFNVTSSEENFFFGS